MVLFFVLFIFSLIMSVRMDGVVDLSSYEIYLTTVNYDSFVLNLFQIT